MANKAVRTLSAEAGISFLSRLWAKRTTSFGSATSTASLSPSFAASSGHFSAACAVPEKKKAVKRKKRAALRTIIGFALQNQGDRAVIYQRDIHHGPETAGLNQHPGIRDFLNEVRIEIFGSPGVCRIDKRGPAAFAAVAEQGKLGDHQH